MNPPGYERLDESGAPPQPPPYEITPQPPASGTAPYSPVHETIGVIAQQPRIVITEQHGGFAIMGITRANQLMARALPTQLGHEPVDTICDNCRSEIRTEVRKVYGYCQWWTFLLLIIFSCYIFAWIPFLFPSMKDTVHSCPRCKGYVGFHRVCCSLL